MESHSAPDHPVRSSIQSALAGLEKETGMVVLHACESGSRAWGFASRDSDWDVRFIYAWPTARYLRPRLPPETITRALPGDLDISGWDLRMTLNQLARSNGALLEWLHSPIIYHRDEWFAQAVAAVREAVFRPKPLLDHYLGLAKSLRAQAGDGAMFNGKKYLYVLRATLAARWVWDQRQPPPVAFAELLPQAPPAIRAEMEQLVAHKAAGSESDAFAVSPALLAFAENERAQLAEWAASLESPAVEPAPLDGLFLETLKHLFPSPFA